MHFFRRCCTYECDWPQRPHHPSRRQVLSRPLGVIGRRLRQLQDSHRRCCGRGLIDNLLTAPPWQQNPCNHPSLLHHSRMAPVKGTLVVSLCGSLPFPPAIAHLESHDSVVGVHIVHCNLHGFHRIHGVEYVGCGSPDCSAFGGARSGNNGDTFGGVVNELGPFVGVDLPNGQEGLCDVRRLGSELHRNVEIPWHFRNGISVRGEPACS
mmetsp:Transcript_15501/g.28028  ORF Transcript_15501/g.28028 Transcript_15501/m.28028 type:complete len:209 (+) Transcript_15501:517-1143(+)